MLSYRRHTSGGGGIYNVNVAETQSRQSRDSPIGGGSYSIVDEKVDNSTINADGMTPITKHTHRKSVFKKRGTSSPSMVSLKIKKIHEYYMSNFLLCKISFLKANYILNLIGPH